MDKKNLKRVLSIVLAATVMLVFSFTTTFAENESPEQTPSTTKPAATTPTKAPTKSTTKSTTAKKTAPKYVTKPVGEYKLSSKGTAALAKITKSKQKTIKTKNIYSTCKYNGVTYKVTKINAKAFAKCKKLKTINVKGIYLKTVDKKAFKGLKKSQIAKIKVKISKKNKNYKKLKKQFKKAGIKSKNIKFY